MHKYLIIFKQSIINSFAYRGRTLVWLLMAIIWIAALPFVWLTVLSNQDGNTIAGFNASAIVTYFFLMPLIESFCMSHADHGIREDIKEGPITNYAIKPCNVTLRYFWDERGWKIQRTVMTLGLMLLIYPFIHNYLSFPALSLYHLWLIPVVIAAVIVSFCLSTIIGYMAFFTTQAEWLVNLWWMFSTFAAGYMAPIAFFPEWVQVSLSYTPFPMIVQTPILVILNQMPAEEIVRQLYVTGIWTIFFMLVLHIMWKRGTKRFDAIGL